MKNERGPGMPPHPRKPPCALIHMMTDTALPRPVATLRGLHVLLVAADPPLSLAIASPLAEVGIAVTVARSASAALGKIADETFDAAIVVDEPESSFDAGQIVLALRRAHRPCLAVLVAENGDAERTGLLLEIGAFEIVVGVPVREEMYLAMERCVRATWSLRSTISVLTGTIAPDAERPVPELRALSGRGGRRPPHDTGLRLVRSVPTGGGMDLDTAVASLASEGGLSPREQCVLRYIAMGYRYQDIGTELAISPRTVKMHAANVRRKCNVGSRWELLRRMYGS